MDRPLYKLLLGITTRWCIEWKEHHPNCFWTSPRNSTLRWWKCLFMGIQWLGSTVNFVMGQLLHVHPLFLHFHSILHQTHPNLHQILLLLQGGNVDWVYFVGIYHWSYDYLKGTTKYWELDIFCNSISTQGPTKMLENFYVLRLAQLRASKLNIEQQRIANTTKSSLIPLK